MNEQELFYHKEHSELFKKLTIAIIIIYVIAGIAIGFVFPKEIQTSFYYSFEVETEFNWLMMLVVWFSGIIPTALVYAVYAHLDNQEVTINVLNDIRSKHIKSTERPVSSGMKKVCPMCHTENPIGADRCENCNALL